ncbi:apolipoprotein N-acyltransferase [Blastococcus goldschmidtiae]|uniref:Apolipoprotein N-acyltransferase n=1 Tax=Blastococcus goldschmidtiae TaxID=3075546 RepID=A0ABU2K7C4_9ACTN|nr:apolipoprotein N-acyltransferase [Blastococcus sp. DSM 46792]MDT0276102.1 apolipoprotein N-acyltransferase [Blastococcus sp. DSM 46792]
MTRTGETTARATGRGQAPTVHAGGGRWRPGWQRLLAGVLAGALLAGSMPPRSAWYLAPVGAAALTWALLGRRWRQRLVLGAVAGFGFFAPTLSWLIDFHPAGFAAVLLLEVALFAGAMLLVDPGRGRWWTVPAALVALEAVRARFPFGGFPLPGIALGQLDGPFAAAAPLGGSFLVVGLTTAAGAAVTGLAVAHRRVRMLVLVAAVAAVSAAGVALAQPSGAPAGQLRTAVVQGGGPRGIPAVEADEQEVTERLFDVSENLPADLDLVLWPESSIGVTGPVADTREADRIAALARRTGATVVAGVTESGETSFRNAAVAWAPDGRIVDRYEKVHRVPFGEYIPARGLFEQLSDMTALVPRDAVPGRGPGLLNTPAGPLGVVISYEVFFSDRARAAVTAGGQVLLVPTNAASYTTEEVPATEVAAARMRAREMDRAVLQAAPTGYTAIVLPDGSIAEQGELGTPELLTATVPLRTGLTPYARTGDLPVLLAVALALIAGPAMRVLHRRDRAADP